MKVLQANHGMCHALLIQVVEMSVELFQQLHQGLLSPIDLGLMLLGVDVLHIGHLYNLEKLISSINLFTSKELCSS